MIKTEELKKDLAKIVSLRKKIRHEQNEVATLLLDAALKYGMLDATQAEERFLERDIEPTLAWLKNELADRTIMEI